MSSVLLERHNYREREGQEDRERERERERERRVGSEIERGSERVGGD